MTLHSTAEVLKKGGIISGIGLGVILLLVIFFKVGIAIKAALNPPKIAPPNQSFGKIAPLSFPQSSVNENFTYTIETLTGKLPDNFPDRLIIYPIIHNTPSLNDLKVAKEKMKRLGFIDLRGLPIPEVSRGGPMYEWTETSGLQRQMQYDIVERNYTMISSYLASNAVLRAEARPNEAKAIDAARGYLSNIDSLPNDIDIEKTRNPDPTTAYNIKPQLFSIRGNTLVPATSLGQTQVVQLSLYQKDIEYAIIAGQKDDLTKFQNFQMKLPILYPHPPASTMHFTVASSLSNGNEVVLADYYHQRPDLTQKNLTDLPSTYPIKTADEAFKELESGNGYIAAYQGSDDQVLIDNVYLAYYLGDSKQDYIMPIVVFEGQNGFFAYVSAIRDESFE